MMAQADQLDTRRRSGNSRHFEAAFFGARTSVEEDDRTLVAASGRGRSEAFEILVRRHHAKILRMASRFTRNYEDAEDIAQLAFQKAFVNLRQFEGNSSFSTWLTRIAMNEALMWLRRHRRSIEVPLENQNAQSETAIALDPPDSAPNPEETCLRLERKRMVSAALSKLTPRVRATLELRELAELSIKETAGIMGLSIGTVKARLFHGRRKLHDKLKQYVESTRIRELASGSSD